jgi:hypothetical protein
METKIMKPYDTWKKNKGRIDLRKYTREFQENFKVKTKCKFEPGKVYAITYTPDNGTYATDKHHITPVILSLGNFRDTDGKIYIRAINLFFLDTRKTIEVLDDAYHCEHLPAGSRVMPIVRLHDKFMHVFPWAFKNFQNLRIRTAVEVPVDDWGMMPLLYKYLIGNFNATALNEDFQKENKVVKKKPFDGKKVEKEKEEEEEQVEYSEEQQAIDQAEFDIDLD